MYPIGLHIQTLWSQPVVLFGKVMESLERGNLAEGHLSLGVRLGGEVFIARPHSFLTLSTSRLPTHCDRLASCSCRHFSLL